MKTSARLVAAAVLAGALFIGNNVKAQTTSTPVNPWRLGIGIEGGVPTGAAHTTSNIDMGGTLRLQYDMSNSFAWTLTSGYYNFFGKEQPAPASTNYTGIGIVPVKVGFKAFYASNLYFAGEAGAGFETNNGTATTSNPTKLILSPGLGWANKTIDLGVRYENFSGQNNNFGFVNLRVAYGFGL